MVTLPDISDYITKMLGSWIGPVPFFVIPALVLGIGVAVWFLKSSVKKERVVDASKGSKLQTAKEYLKENRSEEGEDDSERETLGNNGKIDLEDKLINALIGAVSRAQVSSGTKLSLIVDPSATKKLSLGKSQIDFILNPASDGEAKNTLEMIPQIPEEAEEAV